MSKLSLFLWAVTSHWAVLMTGGMVTAILMALQYRLQKTLSWRFYKWLIAVFIAYACFLAWREEYDRAQVFFEEKADLQGQLLELRLSKGSEEYERAIAKLHAANAQIETELRSTQHAFSALQDSLKARRLSPEERKKLTDVLATHDGQPFAPISVRAFPSCHECMAYVYDFVEVINSVPTWAATGGGNHYIKVDFSSIGIGIKDTRAIPPVASIFVEALTAAGVPFTLETIDFVAPDRCMVIVGNKL